MKAAKYHDYYGFICHKDQDKTFAIKLQHKIENYRIPTKTRIENGFMTKYTRHIFLDNPDLKNPELKKDILENLNRSNRLLVICSKAAAMPVNGEKEWVNPEFIDWCDNPVQTGWIGFEICNFMKKNPEELPYANIIPIVIDGDPKAGDCFHPLLKKYIDKGELKWFDFRKWSKFKLSRHKNGRRGEFIDLMIAILSPYDIEDFRRRDKIRKRWKSGIATAGFAFWAALLALGYDYFIPHSKRYQDYALIEEIPVGLHELSRAELKDYPDYYRITTRKCDRTIKLEHLNQYGTPIEENSENHPYGTMRAVYKCRKDWKPDVVEYLDRNGIVQMTYAYATDLGYVSFQENHYVSRQVYPVSDINSYGIPNRMKIDRYSLEFDDRGLLEYRMYMSGVNYAVNGLGIAGEQYGYDSDGRTISIRFLDKDKQVITNRNGISGLNFQYDSCGTLVRMEYVGKGEELDYGTDAYAYMERHISDGKRVTEYYNKDGDLTVSNHGYAVCVEALDAKMLPEKVSYYGLEENAVYCSDKFHSMSLRYNNNGDVVSKEYYDESGMPIQCQEGYARLDMICDQNGNVLQEDYYGSDDQLILMDHNACTVKREFEEGYLKEETYYGISGDRVFSRDGYFRKENKVDMQGRLEYSAFFGMDDEPVCCKEGYHKIAFAYDNRGNLEFVFVYGTQGQLIPYAGYWAIQEFKYNGGGCVTDVFYSDQFGKPVNIPGNYARIENSYDDSGRLLGTTYYNADGDLATEKYWNDVGVQVGDRFFAKIEFEYDDENNEVTTLYYDETGKPTTEYPFSKKIGKYDEVGNLLQESYYLPDGSHPENYFNNIYYHYNSYGHVVRAEYYGYENKPLATATQSGVNFHIAEISYDYRGNVLERKYFDTEGNEVEHTVYKYDSNGLEISMEYLDPQGYSIPCKDGYSKIMMFYDKQGNEIEKSYFNGEELVVTNDGYAVCQKQFDENNVMTEIRYLDDDRSPINISEGYFCARQTVNQRRNVTEMVVSDKYSTELFTYEVDYNETGQKIMETLYGPDKSLFAQLDSGVALKKIFYDSYGNIKREEYYGQDGEPVLAFGAWAGWEAVYNNEGQEIKRTYLGEDLKPKCIAEGFATVKFDYDLYGREVKRIFCDERELETNCNFGFSRYEVDYVENGMIGSCTFYDADGKIVPDIEGEVRIVNLDLSAKGGIEYAGVRYNAETGKWDQGVIAHSVIKVYRLAFESLDGTYDLMLQPYIPMDPRNQIAEYLVEIQKKYRRIVGENPINLNEYGEEGKIFGDLLKKYTEVVECADTEKLLVVLMLDTLSESVQVLGEQLNVEITEEELLQFYIDFYKQKLETFNQELFKQYGSFKVDYEVMDLQHYSKDTVDQTNVFYKMYGFSGIEIEDAVILNVQFVVIFEGGEEIVTEDFLFPTIQFVKMNGMWKMVMPDGFPRPSNGDVWDFLAQYQL